jgi:integrase
MKRSRYQQGALFTEPRKSGPAVWVYRWRETNSKGKRHSRKEVLGTVVKIRILRPRRNELRRNFG